MVGERSYLDVLVAHMMPEGGSEFDGGNAQAGGALLAAQAARDLCWGTMRYRCESCGFDWRVWLALGVEGPASLKSRCLYMPCPFTISCPAWPNMQPCEGHMSHINWAEDERFPEPQLPPDSVPRFVLPDSGGTCARLLIPDLALVEARRALNEEPDHKQGEGER
jgi:hypothetical protein